VQNLNNAQAPETPLKFYDDTTFWKNSRKLGVKGKAIPLQSWTGPEGSRRLRLPYFKTIGT
jgi:hypothetical protein